MTQLLARSWVFKNNPPSPPKKTCCIFGQRHLPQETWIWHLLLENCARRQCLVSGLRQAGRAGVRGWPSSCPFASDLNQISCPWIWLTDTLGTAPEGRSLFSASDLINEWRGSPGRGNCCWPKGYRKYRMKDDFEMCFRFQKSCHVSDVLSMCLSLFGNF